VRRAFIGASRAVRQAGTKAEAKATAPRIDVAAIPRKPVAVDSITESRLKIVRHAAERRAWRRATLAAPASAGGQRELCCTCKTSPDI